MALHAPKVTIGTPEVRLQTALDDLARQLEGVRTLVVGDSNGLPVASITRGPKTLAATASATMVLSAAASVAANMGLSALEDVLLEGPDYKVLVQGLGHGFSVFVVLSSETNLGIVRLLMNQKAAEIRTILDDLR